MATNGSFHWNELMTRDAEAAKRFYGGHLGWALAAMDQGEGATYWVANVGQEPVAGIYQLGKDDQDTPESWFAYVAVTDPATALARPGGRAPREGGGVSDASRLPCRVSPPSPSSTTMPATRWAG